MTRTIGALVLVAALVSSGCGPKKAPPAAPPPPGTETVAPAPVPAPAPAPESSETRRKLEAVKMSLDYREAPLLPPVFQGLAQGTGVDFWITESIANEPPIIRELRVDTPAPIPELLDRVAAQTGTKWDIQGDRVVFRRAKETIGPNTVLMRIPAAAAPTGAQQQDPAVVIVKQKLQKKTALHIEQRPLGTILGMLSASTDVEFAMTPAVAKSDAPLALKIDQGAPVADILDLLDKLTGTAHEIRGGKVVFRELEEKVDDATPLVPVPRPGR